MNKTSGAEAIVIEGGGFNESWNASLPITTRYVDYGSFLAEGTENDHKRELAAFLANIAHETSGGWATAPDPFLWGLFFNEEVGYENTTGEHYVDHSSAQFPPVPGRSYHGRGPIQLSWNYNYGQMSVILFQDKNVLLQNPEIVVQDGVIGFMTGLWFWLTPQPPKPSAHDVILSTWQPTPADITAGRTQHGFGMTIMVINGGLEGNLTEADGRIWRRVGHYRMLIEKMGANITGEKLDTLGMNSW